MNDKLNIYFQIGQRMREEREAKSLTQADFAKIGGRNRISQASYESGKKTPNLEYLIELSRAGIDIGYILTGIRQDGSLGHDHEVLLSYFDQMSSPYRTTLLETAKALARMPQPAKSIEDVSPGETLHSPSLAYKPEPRDV
jgi:transcriptional regulator with XRE-family HTH domain